MGNEEEAKGGAGDEQKAEMVAKADFDAKTAELDKTNKELEDMRLEVFSQDYLDYLDSKDKAKAGAQEKFIVKEEKEEDLSKLTPKQILDRAKAEAKLELQGEIEKAKKDAVNTVSSEQTKREVAAFARSHSDDFEIYRPIMYGLSLDPKNKDLSLDELYTKSKEHVSRIHSTPSKEEQERQAKLKNERPGGNSESFEKYKKMSPEQTAREAMEETKAKLGPMPSM